MRQYVRNRPDQYPRNNDNGCQAEALQAQPQGGQVAADENMPPPILREDVVTIAGGPHFAGTSRGSQKRYVNELKNNDDSEHVPEPRAPKSQKVES